MTTDLPTGTVPRVTLVAAVARNGVIGADGAMPWHLPADLRRFKALTMGRPMIMGRRTFESIGRPLPGRRSIVVTRDPSFTAPGAVIVGSVEKAIELAESAARELRPGEPEEIMVIGGGQIYRQLLDRADRLEITHVDADVAGDTTFPEIVPTLWREAARQTEDGYSFVTYRREGSLNYLTNRKELSKLTSLTELLSCMRPELHHGEFVFCFLPAGHDVPPDLDPVATISEEAGTSAIVSVQSVPRLPAGARTERMRYAWITLGVWSALDAVGLTAAVATGLAERGIACNIVAGLHHDHLFVPANRASDAMAALAALSGKPGGRATPSAEPGPPVS